MGVCIDEVTKLFSGVSIFLYESLPPKWFEIANLKPLFSEYKS
jgi:hypothetical protein